MLSPPKTSRANTKPKRQAWHSQGNPTDSIDFCLFIISYTLLVEAMSLESKSLRFLEQGPGWMLRRPSCMHLGLISYLLPWASHTGSSAQAFSNSARLVFGT